MGTCCHIVGLGLWAHGITLLYVYFYGLMLVPERGHTLFRVSLCNGYW